MSQLVNAITYCDTKERKIVNKQRYSPLFEELVDVKASFTNTSNHNTLVAAVYDIAVKIGAKCLIDDSPDRNSEVDIIAEAVTRTKRQIIEAVFGEFRQDFRRIEKAIYDFNYSEAQKALYDFEQKMYNPDID